MIYPNIDVGNKTIINQFNKWKKNSNFLFFENFKRDEFIYLLSKSCILIGNSSCGILEASSFKLPVINIGTRQRGRLQPQNVINTKNSSSEIIKSIKYVLKIKVILKLKNVKIHTEMEKSSGRIVNILKNIKIDHKL